MYLILKISFSNYLSTMNLRFTNGNIRQIKNHFEFITSMVDLYLRVFDLPMGYGFNNGDFRFTRGRLWFTKDRYRFTGGMFRQDNDFDLPTVKCRFTHPSIVIIVTVLFLHWVSIYQLQLLMVNRSGKSKSISQSMWFPYRWKYPKK